MKIIIAPDKFKGSLTAQAVCDCIESGVLSVNPNAEVEALPLADGGEGTLDLMIDTLKLQRVAVTVKDPLLRDISTYYGINGKNAYVELALASGLQLLSATERSAMHTSSYGTGQMIRDAIKNGARNITVFAGGSATNDGGIGAASALGFKFLDQEGKPIHPVGANLNTVHKIGLAEFDAEIKLVTDVQNTLTGEHGATYMYAEQKGAVKNELELLENGLAHLAQKVEQITDTRTTGLQGAGAAGGMAVCVAGLLKGDIVSGIETVLQAVRFDQRIQGADLIITGEGKIDEQTLQGKVVSGVANIASKNGISCIAFCGQCSLTAEQLEPLKLAGVASIKQERLSTETCIQNAAPLLVERVTGYLKRRAP